MRARSAAGIGANATFLPDVTVGRDAVAGSGLTRDIAPGVTAMGVPARPVPGR